MKYSVDVKAFISVTVEAETEEAARSAADCFVETLSPTEAYIGGYNDENAMQGIAARIVSSADFDIDGESEVDEDA